MLTGLVFQSPWILSALAAIPVLWWLLRVMPPRPKTVIFPAFFLLKTLEPRMKSAAHTPWWLLLLRCMMVALFVIAFAGPVLHPAEGVAVRGEGPALIIMDNGWASASHWPERRDKLKEILRQMKRDNRAVVFVLTAASATDGRVYSQGPFVGAALDGFVEKLKPEPWPASYEAAKEVIEKVKADLKPAIALYLSDGLAAPAALVAAADTLVTDDVVNDPYILRYNAGEEENVAFTVERLYARAQDEIVDLLVYGEGNTLVDEMKIKVPAGKRSVDFEWESLPEIRSRAVKIVLRRPEMASTSFMTSHQWRQHPVGIIGSAEAGESKSFLDEIYYLRRALETAHKITVDKLDVLLKARQAVLVLPDSTVLTAAESAALAAWVKEGGLLIRFAGSHLSAHPEDQLLPVALREGQRAMSGAMTWETPKHLAVIAEQSPLFGLAVPSDVTVTRQLLAEPTPEVFTKTWLQLEDGTPLITGSVLGKGTLVLVHTSAGPDWSNFCYSGLFVEVLQRMAALSNGISHYQAEAALSPLQLVDGFGRLGMPQTSAAAATLNPADVFEPSPVTPPGIYGTAQEFTVFNLGDHLQQMRALEEAPARISVLPYQKMHEIDLQPLLIQAAILLLLCETLATFRLRGVMIWLLAVVISFSSPARAETKEVPDLGLHLAYIETGDVDIDSVAFNGLTALGDMINERTTAKIEGVDALNPDDDVLVKYPVIYWAMTDAEQGLSTTAAQNIQNYLNQGGMILFDTRDGQFGADQNSSTPGTRQLRKLMEDIQIPELVNLPAGHILSRSFYLLDEMPGRYTGSALWVEKEPNPRYDGVTSVVIGGNDWAAAWSRDPADMARFSADLGGAAQREVAYRFGVNVVMVALTGNYKADQVHVPHILERLGQ